MAEPAENSPAAEPAAPTPQPDTPVTVAHPRKSLAPLARKFVVVAAAAVLAGAVLFSIRSLHQEQRESQQIIRRDLAAIEQTLRAAQSPAPAPPARQDAPEDYAKHLARGNDLQAKGNFSAAAAEYGVALQACPSFKLGDEALYRLGLCLLKIGNHDQATESFRAVLTRFPGSAYEAATLYELATMLMIEGRYAQARQLLYQLLLVKDNFAEASAPYCQSAYYAIARCYESEAELVARALPLPAAPLVANVPNVAKTE